MTETLTVRQVNHAGRKRGIPRPLRGAWVLLVTIIAALILIAAILAIGTPGLTSAKEAAIKQSLLSDAQNAINAEQLYYSMTGQYVDANLDNSGGDTAIKDALDTAYPNIKTSISPHNTVQVSTYTGNNGEDCFKVTVTNSKLTNIEAVYDSCDDNNASPYITNTSNS